jgi:putative endonuclease
MAGAREWRRIAAAACYAPFMRSFHVYILASLSRCIYVGVTNDLMRRVAEHKQGTVPGFTRTYRVNRLVYFEQTADVRAALSREKQLKRWPRWRKDRLIEKANSAWEDLSVQWAADVVIPRERSRPLSSRRSEASVGIYRP